MFLAISTSGILFVLVILLLLPVLACREVLNNEYEGDNKIIWFFVILFLPVFGSIFYFFRGRKDKIKEIKP